MEFFFYKLNGGEVLDTITTPLTKQSVFDIKKISAFIEIFVDLYKSLLHSLSTAKPLIFTI